jgi:hypothetical protein
MMNFATKQSRLGLVALDCFAEPVIGPAKPDPLARNAVTVQFMSVRLLVIARTIAIRVSGG